MIYEIIIRKNKAGDMGKILRKPTLGPKGEYSSRRNLKPKWNKATLGEWGFPKYY